MSSVIQSGVQVYFKIHITQNIFNSIFFDDKTNFDQLSTRETTLNSNNFSTQAQRSLHLATSRKH